MRRIDPCNVLMVYPRFSPHSFWNYKETYEIAGARYSGTPLGLITVAALLPREWNLRLIDRNTEELTDADLDWADVVMTGGMLSQQRDVKRMIIRAQEKGKPVVIGGPDVTCSPHVYVEAEFLVLGEAEEIMADFVAAWRAGEERGVFKAPAFPDLARSPVPRFDLLKLKHFMHVGVQFSRGCPFGCEFCNVIELNGRTPRVKSPEQMLAELDALYALGYRGHIDFVDDNLIGNRKLVKQFLVQLGSWLERHNHPFEFSTEASIDLAEDEELMQLMRRADFFIIFVGIESPEAATLRQTNKKQNTRRDIVESVRKIYRHGISVNAGFIIGFDGETDRVAETMIRCIEASAIPVAMVGLLYALPNTALSRRLQAEGRLHAESDRPPNDEFVDQCTSGLNYTTLRPRREILEDYRIVLGEIFTPAAYFARVTRMVRELDLSQRRYRSRTRHTLRDLRTGARILWRSGVKDREVRGPLWKALGDCLLHNPRGVKTVVSYAALYLHFKPYARFMCSKLESQLGTLGEETIEAACSTSAFA